MGNNTVLVIIKVCFCAWDKYTSGWLTDRMDGWMDWLFLWYCGLILDWNKFPWLFEIVCFGCLDCLAWEFFVLSSTQRSTFTTFPLHMNALFGFLRGPNDLYAAICMGKLYSRLLCLLYFYILLSHFWHRQMHILHIVFQIIGRTVFNSG